MDISEEYARWKRCADARYAADLEALADDEQARIDAFRCNLAFGTAGLRGILGAGPNRMNIHTVAKATQGLADYLNRTFENPSVAIARDSRLQGDVFERVAAGVLAANGVKAYLYPRIEPTPALSFAVRDLGASAGICVTASHNPCEYNGYKVYGPDGCQITTQAARDIQRAIDETDVFDDVSIMPFDQAVSEGLACWTGEDTLDRFEEAVLRQSVEPADGSAADTQVSIVYTPLNGTGLECVTRVLDRIGGVNVTLVEEQKDPDGRFPTCPYPNPEIRPALEKGLETCERVHPDLLLATDPDADRVGVAVAHDGGYQLLSGNEMGVLLTDFIAKAQKAAGRSVDDAVVVSTIVSSSMVDALARAHGFEVRRTLTGFKYIGDQIGLLEADGQADRYMFGFEESYGYLRGSHVRDKDAVVTSMLICQMARYYKNLGMDLIQAMNSLYDEYGYYGNGLISLSYPGAEGAERMVAITSGLRQQAPAAIAGLRVERVVDYATGVAMPVVNGRAGDAEQQLPAADVLEFQLEGGSKVLVRPSGTEPKIKAYLFAQAETVEQGAQLLADLDAAMRELLS